MTTCNSFRHANAHAAALVCASVVNATVSASELAATVQEIAQDVKEQLLKSMETFGFSIIQTLVTDIEPAAKVKTSMNEINAARRMREAALEKAEADKVQVVKAAEADAESKFLAGQGIARQRQAIINGLRESVKVRPRSHNISAVRCRGLSLLCHWQHLLTTPSSASRCSALCVSIAI